MNTKLLMSILVYQLFTFDLLNHNLGTFDFNI